MKYTAIMKQKCYVMRCKLRNVGIGDGMCCKWCEDIKRPDNPEHGQICEYERTEKVYYREV